jgi:hypothetical protein
MQSGGLMTITLEDAIRIREAGRMLAEMGMGPDLGEIMDRIDERWPEIKESSEEQ